MQSAERQSIAIKGSKEKIEAQLQAAKDEIRQVKALHTNEQTQWQLEKDDLKINYSRQLEEK